MPYEVKKTPSCPIDKPFGVFNKDSGTLNGRCHVSRAKALAQTRALYAAESDKMNSEIVVVNRVKEFSEPWLDGNKRWVMIYPFGSWSHPIFSDTMIDADTATALKDGFDKKVYGDQELAVTYDHGFDPAKGGKAAGWYEQLDVRSDGLWGLIRFTPEAKEEIDSEEWRYFSGEHFDEWKNPHTGEVSQLVFSGGAVTNKPYVKDGCIPLNFSDIYVEREQSNSEDKMPDTPTGEHAGQEHSEPGTNGEPRTDEAPSDKDNAAAGVDTPPATITTDIDARLREILGLGDDADIIKAVSDIHAEVKPLREAAKAHSERKSFAEAYPEQARELEESRKERRDNAAKMFSDRFMNILDKDGKPTGKGYPAVVTNKLIELHKKFSDKTATVVDFTEVMDLIGNTGLVDFSEAGSSRQETYENIDHPEKAFADKVIEIQTEDSIEYMAAVAIAERKYPELFEAYQRSIPGRR